MEKRDREKLVMAVEILRIMPVPGPFALLDT